MDELALTVDLGNSRLKLCVWDLSRRAPLDRRALDARAGVGSAAAEFARERGPLRVVALSSVGSMEIESEVCDALRAAISAPLVVAPDCGLAIEVREPDRVGRDRLYAARGALECTRGSAVDVVVVDAGTALTVDAVDVRGRGRFLGGAIAPGPQLSARALADHTARLPLVEPEPDVSALGRDTQSAVRAGVVVGFRGSALELATRIAEEARFRAPFVVVTGGASHLLRGVFETPRFERVVEDADLVHRGLLASSIATLAR